MKALCVLACLLTLVALGCQREASVASSTHSATVARPVHETERIASAFISDATKGRYATTPIEFPADFQLAADERIVAFRMLERYVTSTSWKPHYAAITVFNGQEDSADIYYRGSGGEWLLLICAYHYDTKDWHLDAYEIPKRAFARPVNESFSDYMAHGVAESSADTKPYVAGVTADGTYSIAY